MIINVGSKNPNKVQAVQEIVKEYDFLDGAQIIPLDVPSGISEQPKSLEETIDGAINRSTNAFGNCKYSIGIESGLMTTPHPKVRERNICVCSIYDGKEPIIGISSAFKFPPKITLRIHQDNIDASEAFLREGLTNSKKIGAAPGGILGLLTKGKINRVDYTKQALTVALIELQNPTLYK